MMNLDSQLKLQAWLDGELSAHEARRVERRLAADAEARALADELRHTKQALAGNETAVRVPETRDFYWSKIEREIRRQETAERTPARGRFGVWWKRILVPAVSVACVAIIAGLAIKQFGGGSSVAIGRHELVASLADPGAITYRDDSAGITLVWFSYGSQK